MQPRLLYGWLLGLTLTLPAAAEPNTRPTVIGGEAQQQLHATGDIIYVEGIGTPLYTRFWLIRNDTLADPNHVAVLRATALGIARLVAHGKPATLVIENARQEIRAGDRLIPVLEPR